MTLYAIGQGDFHDRRTILQVMGDANTLKRYIWK